MTPLTDAELSRVETKHSKCGDTCPENLVFQSYRALREANLNLQHTADCYEALEADNERLFKVAASFRALLEQLVEHPGCELWQCGLWAKAALAEDARLTVGQP